jgi:hypothetical protein
MHDVRGYIRATSAKPHLVACFFWAFHAGFRDDLVYSGLVYRACALDSDKLICYPLKMAPTPQASTSCPVCKAAVPKNPRFRSSYLCAKCTKRATDGHGRVLGFQATSLPGSDSGFEARFQDDGSLAGEVTRTHTVYVGASPFYAKHDVPTNSIILSPHRLAIKKDEPFGLCPICHALTRFNPRYPDHLCGSCASRAVDEQGRALVFYNESISGGFMAKYADDGSPATKVSKSHIAYVGHLKVLADEARFGGIVVVPVPKKD